MIYVIRQWEQGDLVGVRSHLERNGLAFQLIEAWDSPMYPSLEEGDVIIGLGGPPSVSNLGEEGYEWPFVTLEAGFLGQAMALDIPFLGICLSHQLRAKLVNEKVERLTLEVGAVDVELTEAGRSHWLFEGLPDPFRVFAYHFDQVTSLPPEATLLGSSTNTLIEAVAWDDRHVSVQFHPEALKHVLLERIDPERLLEQGSTVQEMVDSFPPDYDTYTQRLFDNFLARAGCIPPRALIVRK